MINIKSVRRQLNLLFDARYVFTYISIYSKDNLELRSWIKQRDHLNNAWKRKTLIYWEANTSHSLSRKVWHELIIHLTVQRFEYRLFPLKIYLFSKLLYLRLVLADAIVKMTNLCFWCVHLTVIKVHAYVTKKSDSSLAGSRVSGECYKPLGNGCESAPLCVLAKKLGSC